MSHDTHHSNPKDLKSAISFKNSFWLVAIIVGLFIAAINFVQAESCEEEGHGGHEAKHEMHGGHEAAAGHEAAGGHEAKAEEAKHEEAPAAEAKTEEAKPEEAPAHEAEGKK